MDGEESVACGRVAGLVERFVGAGEVDEVDLVEGEDYGAEGLEGCCGHFASVRLINVFVEMSIN